jgi:DNA topoisomerase I
MKKIKTNVFDIPGNDSSRKLRYVNDKTPGISRKKRGDFYFYYDSEGKRICDTDVLNRIKSLVIPPAWQKVWVSPYPDSHLQATGFDVRGRKQYRYHPDWNLKRSELKFNRLPHFLKLLPIIRKETERHLKSSGMNKEKVIAAVVDIMSKVYFRIGNNNYAKENGSYGLTTLLDKHVEIKGDALRFEFRGKKGVMQEVTLRDRRLSHIVKSCRDIPGQELFQFYDGEGKTHVIDSGDINNYLHELCGQEFSAKDFRTWAGTLHAFRVLAGLPTPETQTEFKHKTVEVIKEVSRLLGNTPAVCRKYYIHPLLFESYEKGELQKLFQKHSKTDSNVIVEREETMLLQFLEAKSK